MIKLTVKLTPEKQITPEAQEWLNKISDRLNSSKKMKQMLVDFAVFGASNITCEDVVKEIRNER